MGENEEGDLYSDGTPRRRSLPLSFTKPEMAENPPRKKGFFKPKASGERGGLTIQLMQPSVSKPDSTVLCEESLH